MSANSFYGDGEHLYNIDRSDGASRWLFYNDETETYTLKEVGMGNTPSSSYILAVGGYSKFIGSILNEDVVDFHVIGDDPNITISTESDAVGDASILAFDINSELSWKIILVLMFCMFLELYL